MEKVFTFNNVALKNSYNKCFMIKLRGHFLMNYCPILNISDIFSLNISRLLIMMNSLNTNTILVFEL